MIENNIRAHIIKDGKVENTIVVESLDVMPGLISAEDGGAIGDSWDGFEFTPPVIPEPSFDELKAEITAKINALFAKETAQIKGQVMQEEVDTFPTQEKEALGFTADNTFPTPLLNTLAIVRDITVADLAVRVLDHAEAYKHAIGLVMGKKNKLQDQVNRAESLDDLKLIVVE